jgi:tRNA (guanine37-N1)-methyltransferase
MRIDVLTTFPEMFAPEPPAALGSSIPARARRAGLVEWHAHNIRDFTSDKHQKTDDRPFGGGPGMVMMCQPLMDALTAVEALDPRAAVRVHLTPQGYPLTQELVERLAQAERLVLLAGHYEGIDERFIEETGPLEISLGDYVLSGGELAAMVLIDAVVRLLPGALGDEESAEFDSFSTAELPRPKKAKKTRGGSGGEAGTVVPSSAAGVHGVPPAETASPDGPLPPTARLLDCPHYTKPRVWRERAVPEVLLSGDHGRIAAWRLEQRVRRTRERRPDLLVPRPGFSPSATPTLARGAQSTLPKPDQGASEGTFVEGSRPPA